jgi:hypothetical protein
MSARVEEEYQDLLQNIEFAIVQVYRREPELTDYEVKKALDALERRYKAVARGREAPTHGLDGLPEQVFQEVEATCEWRLGTNTLEQDGEPLEVPAVPVDVIVQCLRRIGKSVQFWTREMGRQGYLEYVSPYLP